MLSAHRQVVLARSSPGRAHRVAGRRSQGPDPSARDISRNVRDDVSRNTRDVGRNVRDARGDVHRIL